MFLFTFFAERCGPMSSALGPMSGGSDPEPPQPLVTRRPSVSLPKWATSPSAPVAAARLQPLSLSTLDRDCFIIPVHSLDRFLPDGVPVNFTYSKNKYLFILDIVASMY